LLARFNFAGALLLNNIKGTRVDTSKLIADDADPPKSAAEVARVFLSNRASDETRSALEKLASAPPAAVNVPISAPASSPLMTSAKPDVGAAIRAQLIALALGSPEFQRK
ncbi:MAG TPA: hypothetical protein VHL50_00390, partial [Pyrinomonadaceae bacterium]|nr:hypothetical protein [Pyrinomonadaceae bacterium]